MTLKEKIKDLLINDKMGDAIDLARTAISKIDEDYDTTLILLKSQYNSNESDNTDGILKRDDYRRTKISIQSRFQSTVARFPQNILNTIINEVNINGNNQISVTDSDNSQITINDTVYSNKTVYDNSNEVNNELDKFTETLNSIIRQKENLLKADNSQINQKINDLTKQFKDLKQELSGELQKNINNTVNLGDGATGNFTLQNISKSNMNFDIKNGLASMKNRVDEEIKELQKLHEETPKDIAIKILFMSANPDDQHRITSEFDTIRQKLKRSIDNKELDFLNPTWETDYERLIMRLKEDKPNVLQYSGHGTEKGICLKNTKNGQTQLLENDELEEIFENRKYLKLIFLNSCFSSIQAKIISEQGIYVLGVKNQLLDDLSGNLAEDFYLGFIAQEPPLRIERAIKIGCRNFCKNYPEHKDLISLWKNGEEINYRSLK